MMLVLALQFSKGDGTTRDPASRAGRSCREADSRPWRRVGAVLPSVARDRAAARSATPSKRNSDVRRSGVPLLRELESSTQGSGADPDAN